MIILKPIKDINLLIKALKKDNLYINILGSDNWEVLKAQLQHSAWFEGHYEDNKVVGLIMIRHLAGNCFLFHGGVYKAFRGKNSLKYVKDSLDVIRQGNPEIVFMTTVSSDNRLAIALDKKLGLIEKTRIPNGCSSGDLVILSEV